VSTPEQNDSQNIPPDLTAEWLESFEDLAKSLGPSKAGEILGKLFNEARRQNIALPDVFHSPYINTIPREKEPQYPGDTEIERKLRAYIRWNAAAMVLRANKFYPQLGGHLSTYASAASLFEVGFNHFFKGPDHPQGADHVFFQGHASPGIYARAYLEGRLGEEDLDHFRREVIKGLSSYPHPRLMPEFWQFPTVSMGLGPLMAAHLCYFETYLTSREIIPPSSSKTWCFCGDGELDEPESANAIALAGRENLSNLIFVVNCNLQRLDGPVRGNSKIIQELEARFVGAGWRVIKVIWGSRWDPLLESPYKDKLIERMNQALDGDYQKYVTESGSFIREHFFGTDPDLKKLVENYSDEELATLPRGGHDVKKLYAAYLQAVGESDRPTAILAKTVKGWHLGPRIEARNATHAVKSMTVDDLISLRDKLGLTAEIPDELLKSGIPPYVKPSDDSREIQYLLKRRQVLGGFLPFRRTNCDKRLETKTESVKELYLGSETPASTTGALARIIRNLTKDPEIGPKIVPIVPDEGRSFGLDPLFSEIKIYSPKGQKYIPVDADLILSYRESEHGQVLEEGISEADAMASFIASGTSYCQWNEPTIPFYLFYSMFGFQRVGDLIWAAADIRARGFLIGTTAGRTTYNGEGLQHEDGHSHLFAHSIPNLRAYDCSFAYEIAILIEHGIKEMYGPEAKDVFYYITTYNENYIMPKIPEDEESKIHLAQGVISGLYRYLGSQGQNPRVSLWFSGPLFQEALRARDILYSQFNIESDLWAVTSVKALREDALIKQRQKRLGLSNLPSYLDHCLEEMAPSIVGVSDFMAANYDLLARFILPKKKFITLGTEGFGRSDTREMLRTFFEINADHIVIAALDSLGMEEERKSYVSGLNIRGPSPFES
jgi:pyruvate dehydrogenase E1 component